MRLRTDRFATAVTIPQRAAPGPAELIDDRGDAIALLITGE